MAKIIALYINELIKISRKISVYVILIIMLAGMFLTGGLLKYAQVRMQAETTNPNSAQSIKKDTSDRLSILESQLTETNNKMSAATPEQKKQLELDAAKLGYQIEGLNTATNMNIDLYNDYYLAQAIQDLISYKTEVSTLQSLPTETLTQAQKDNQTLLISLIPRMEKVIANKDFNDYTSVINQKINADANMSQTDKDIQLEQNNLRLKYNVTNEGNNGIFGKMQTTPDDVIKNIGSARSSLVSNLDFSANKIAPVPLTNERRAQITDKITVYLKQLDTGAIETNNFSTMNYILSIGTFMIEILLLILAGGAISQELSTGSIKSLIISPTKRWKIYVAKLLSLVTVGVLAAIICYFIGILVFGIFFGLGSASPYIYTSSGNSMLMNFYLFTFAKLFIGLIEVAFYMVLALMLSTITRNTAASVGISIGVLFGGSIAYSVLTNILTGEWLKFLPFANFNFSAKIFSFDPSIAASAGASTSITFSAIYIITFLSLMFYIGLDSFNRRDIK